MTASANGIHVAQLWEESGYSQNYMYGHLSNHHHHYILSQDYSRWLSVDSA